MQIQYTTIAKIQGQYKYTYFNTFSTFSSLLNHISEKVVVGISDQLKSLTFDSTAMKVIPFRILNQIPKMGIDTLKDTVHYIQAKYTLNS